MSIIINRQDLDAATLELAVLAGLLIPKNANSEDYTLTEDWFSDPVSHLAQGLKSSGTNLPALIKELIGSRSGSTLNIPSSSAGSLGTWYPLLEEDDAEALSAGSGPYLISRASQGGGQTYGLGFQIVQNISEDLQARLWGILPILLVDGTPQVALSDPNESLLLGVELVSATGPLVNIAGFSLDGVRMSVAMAPAQTTGSPVDVSLEIVKLKTPGEEQASDVNLSDLQAASNEEVMGAVRGLLVAALAQIVPADSPEISLLFPAIGFGGSVAGNGDVPAIDWLSLLENSDDLAKPFIDWLQIIASDTSVLKAWGAALSGLATGAIPNVQGEGTEVAPYQFLLKTIGTAGTLYLTLETATDSDGTTHLLPGLSFQADAVVLGSSSAQLVPSASLTFVDLGFSDGALAIAPAPLIAQLTLENKVQGSPLVSAMYEEKVFSIGSLDLGLELTPSGDTVNLLPKFEFVAVEIAGSSHASLNLLQPEKVASVVAGDLASVISQKLQSLLGTQTGSPGFALSVLLGLAAPTTSGFTQALTPPLSPSAFASNITDPLGALQSWYYAVLSADEPVAGALPAQWIAQMVATLMVSGSSTVASSSAAGTPDDPWLFPLLGSQAKVYLKAYRQNEDLILGLQVGVDFQLTKDTALDLSLGADLLTLETSSTSAQLTGARTFSALDLKIALPDGVSTGTSTGTSLSIDSAAAQVGWSSQDSFSWQISVAKSELKDGNTVVATGSDLIFAKGESWADKLSGAGTDTFAPLLLGITGLALLRSGTRAGVLLDGWFGLLGGDISKNLPQGISWPDDMPRLGSDVLTTPLEAINTQFNSLFSHSLQAQAALSLLGWALGSDSIAPVISAPSNGGPYLVPLPTSTGIELAIWDKEQAGDGVVIGLNRAFSPDLAGDVDISVNVSAELFSSATSSEEHTPSVTIVTDLTGKSGELVKDTLRSAEVGLTLLLTSDGPAMAPILSVTPTNSSTQIKIDLENPATALTAANSETLLTLLNAGVRALVDAYGDNPMLIKLAGLLETAGLAVQVDGTFALNAQAWLQLTAAPTEFFSAAGTYLLEQSEQREDLVDLLTSASGLKLPDVPEELLAVLAALGLTTSQSSGYLPVPNAILALVSNPAKFLPTQLAALMSSETKRAALASAFGQSKATASFGPVSLSVLNANDFMIELANPIMFGSSLKLGGALSFNLTDKTLAASLNLDADQIESGIGLSLASADFNTPEFSAAIRLGSAEGTFQPAQVRLYPFSAQDFLQDLEQTVPAMLLGRIVADALGATLADHPVAIGVATALGLTSTGSDGQTNLHLPLQFIDHPADWLLEKTLMGVDGALSIEGLSQLFSQLPSEGTAGSGVYLLSQDNSITVAGLPYNLELVFTADVDANRFTISPRLNETLQLSSNLSISALNFGLALTPDLIPVPTAQIAFSGSISDNTPKFELSAAYDNTFSLSVGQVDGPTLDLIPFTGWLEFAKDVAAQAAQKLISEAATQLLDNLKTEGAAEFVGKLQTAAQDLDVPELVEELTNAALEVDGGQSLEDIAIDWVKQRLTSANATNTAQAVVALLADEVDGITSKDGLVSYQPVSSIPLVISFGIEDSIAGLWARMQFDAGSGIRFDLTKTGIGYPIASGGNIQFDLGLSVEADLFGETGPRISADWSNSAGFSLLFNPLGTGGAYAIYDAQLLPVPFPGTDGTAGGGLEAWLEDLALHVLPRYAALGLLNASVSKAWLDQKLLSGKIPAPGTILTSIGLITEQDGVFMPASPQALAGKTVSNVLAALINAILSDLTADSPLTLVSLPDNGKLQISSSTNEASKAFESTPDYTLSLVVPSIAIKNSGFALQLGNAQSGDWIKQAGKSGTGDYVPGLSVSISVPESGPDFEHLRFSAAYIGVSLEGKNGKPLIDLSRFSLEGVTAQGLLSLEFGDGDPVKSYGAGGDLSNIAFALSPGSVTGTGANPVAQNLLGSSSSDAKGTKPAVNPAFDATLGWISDGTFGAALEQDGKPVSEIYLPVQRSFGPLQVNGIGADWHSSKKQLGMLFDGGIQTTAVTLEVIGLDVSVPITDPTDFDGYGLDLSGLALAFKGGTVSLSGDLLKQTSDTAISYDGEINASTSLLGLTAVGSYALMPANPGEGETQTTSMFIFGDVRLGGALGGPPAFSIQGFAGGFSINRGLTLPDVSQVDSFPLIQAVSDPTFIAEGSSPSQVLAKFDKVIPPQIGNYWGAAGLNVSSFELVNTFAMLIANFGASFSFDAIGLAKATMPPDVSLDKALAYIELGVTMSFEPSEGEFALTGQLSPSSFILSHNCHLTGGFAVRAWFGDNENAGDFVITLGGYSPAFKAPDYYPAVPRVGFDWRINSDTSISGGTYFALTPSAIMAGADLSAQFRSGKLHAWFDAGADFLISWAPFYYDIDVHVDVGVSYTIDYWIGSSTFSASLGAGLHLFGPQTGGSVYVDWYIISFSIPFGDGGSNRTSGLTWPAFAQKFLPKNKQRNDEIVPLIAAVQSGQVTGAAANTVQAKTVEFKVTSSIPATQATFTNTTEHFESGGAIGVKPVGWKDNLDTELTVSITAADEANDISGFVVEPINNGVPAALWSQGSSVAGSSEEAAVVKDAIVGLKISTAPTSPSGEIGPITMSTVYTPTCAQSTHATLPFATIAQIPADAPEPQENAFSVIQTTIASEGVEQIRKAMGEALNDVMLSAIDTPDMSVMKEYADQILIAPPQLAQVGTYVNTPPAASSSPPAISQPTDKDAAAAERFSVRKPGRVSLIGYGRLRAMRGFTEARNGLPSRQRTRWFWHNLSSYHFGEPNVIAEPGRAFLFEAARSSVPLLLDISNVRSLDLRVIALDRAGRILSHTVTQEERLVLPARTHRIAVFCEPVSSTRSFQLKGWLSDQKLMLVGDGRLVGEGCTVFTRGALEQMSRFKPGPNCMENIVAADVLEHVNGTRVNGTVETLFKSEARTIAVVVTHSDDAPTDILLKRGERAGGWHAAEPVQSLKLGGSEVLFFEGARGQPVHVLTSASHEVQGVFASALPPSQLKATWKRQVLGTFAAPATHNPLRAFAKINLSRDER
ncbi:hypothetical protein PsAD2_01948 [Pseudovibrio axinellae]|uniref:DUF6603 domain-containing protein n=1 Tax=Pseudovibrio axinellae TaxID=989403 RepID=A0A165Z0S6_9HYPH|nr:DUF6603 domain-containing protein [Pseudovibrio axinellae]KZL19409.1 hypothetical protein PsAD2_01948 [Pseudovibrio axinellae]SER59141.1 hypothetical protein SAMN05421798_11346 [Pseudovibrio axinellae]